MTSSINYNDTLFKRSKLTPIRVEPTFKTLHKLKNKIKANDKSVHSNLWGVSYCHLGLVITDVQYVLISNTPFVYLTHLGLFIVSYGTTAHVNSNMYIMHTNTVRLFQDVMKLEQALVQ